MVDENITNFKTFLIKYIDEESFEVSVTIFVRLQSYCLRLREGGVRREALAVLLQREPSLFNICDHRNSKVPVDIIEKFCDLISNFCLYFKSDIVSYISNIKNYLLEIINSRSSRSKSKELSIKALQKAVIIAKESSINIEEVSLINNLLIIIQSKSGKQVLSCLLELLGKLSQLYPDSFLSKSMYETLTLEYLGKEIYSSNNSSSIPLISGCIEGLKHFYEVNDYNRREFTKLYKMLLLVLEKDSAKRYSATKSSLKFLSIHFRKLIENVFADMEKIYKSLSKLCQHYNTELRYCATKCMDSLLSVVGSHLKEQSNNQLLSTTEISAFNFLISNVIKRITDVQSSKLSSITLIESDIRGLGHLARTYSSMLTVDNLDTVYEILVDQVWKEYNLDKGEEDTRLEFVNSKIYQIKSILTSLLRILNGLLISQQSKVSHSGRGVQIICRLTLILIEFYPRISFYKAYMYRDIFDDVVTILKDHSFILHLVLKEIVYQAIIYSCSFPIPPDYNIIQDISTKVPITSDYVISDEEEVEMVQTFSELSLRDFLPFWNTILKYVPDNEETSFLIFDFFVECALNIIDKLNLSYVDAPSSHTDITSNPVANKLASAPKDFVVFVNLCELFQFVLRQRKNQKVERWAPTCVKEFVRKCLELPLVSGFYKLITSILVDLESFNYFECCLNESNIINDESTKNKALILDDIKVVLSSMLTRLSNFNDELLLACLTLLVNIPTIIWRDVKINLSQEVIAHIKMAIQLGSYYVPLGHACLDMLCRWIKDIRFMEKFLEEILPSLSTFLMFSTVSLIDERAEDDKYRMKLDSLVSARRDSRNISRLLRFIQETDRRRLCGTLNDDSEAFAGNKIVQLQMRLMRILGELGIGLSRKMVCTPDNSSFNDIGWNKSPCSLIPYSVPFVDMKPQICFEYLLPSIANIVFSSCDCQTKSIASEVIHAIMTLLIGQITTSPSPRDRERLIPLFTRMLGLCLKLATDINKVSKALFSDLLFQLAFWYSYPHNEGLMDTNCFIESLFNAVQSPIDEVSTVTASNDINSGNLQRDMAGHLLKYMLESSISYSNDENNINSSRLTAFLSRIYNLLNHFSSQKRLGAVFILNSIHDTLCKDQIFMKNEIFLILYSTINCQRLSEGDKRSGIFEQLEVSFKNLTSFLNKFKDEFIVKNDSHRKPPSWDEATIKFAILWLLESWKSSLTYYRKRCMNMTECLLQSYNIEKEITLLDILLNDKGVEYFIKISEDPRLLGLSLTPDNECCWCSSLAKSIGCYTWFIENKVSGIERCFQGSSSTLYFSINSFTKYYTNSTVSSSKYMRQVSLKLMSFIRLMLSKCYEPCVFPGIIKLDSVFNFLACFVVLPFRFSFDMNDNRRVVKVHKEVEKLLLVLKDDRLILFMEKLRDMLGNYQFQLNLLEIKDSGSRVLSIMEAEYLFRLFEQIALIHPDISFLDSSTKQIISKAAIDNNQSISLKTIQLTTLDYLLSIKDEKFLEDVVDFLEGTEGIPIFSKYKSSILKRLRRNPHKLIMRISVQNWRTLLPILSNLLDEEIKCKTLEKRGIIVQSIIDNWERIWKGKDPLKDIDIAQLTLTIDVVKKMVVLDNKICSNQHLVTFFCTILALDSVSLDLKNSFIYLLPSFYDHSSLREDYVTEIVTSVKSLVINHLITLSTTFLLTEVQKTPVFNIIKAIFECLQIDCKVALHSKWLRGVIAPIICMDAHQCWAELLRRNLKILCYNLDSKKQVLCLIELEDEMKLQIHFPHLLKFLHNIYVVFILYSRQESLTTFFLTRISSLKNTLQLPLDDISTVQSQQIFVNLEILCAVYRGLGPLDKNLKSDLRESKIISELSKICRAIVDVSSNTPPLIYFLRSSAFSCLCAIVIATQSGEKFYTHLLLKPNLPLFEQFIQKGDFQKFPNELTFQSSRTIYFRTTSSSDCNRQGQGYTQGHDVENVNKRIHISSQFLSDSSLALDTNKLEHIFQQHNNIPQFNYNNMDEIKIDLENDEVNNHPCMETMIFLLQHMMSLGFIAISNNVTATSEVPTWMKVFRDRYVDQSMCLDIKYFITKLILNCRDIFNHYAIFWLPGFINFIRATQPSFNKFTVSVVDLISQWLTSPHALETVTRSTLNDLVKVLIDQCHSDNPAINALTLQLYQNFIKSLCGKVDIPYKYIFDNIRSSPSNIINTKLQLLAYSLPHKYPLMVESDVENTKTLIKPLFQNLKHKTKVIYAPTFEVCGMLMSEAVNDLYNELHSEITSSLEFVLCRNLSDYVTCLALVTIAYEKFSKSQYVVILSNLKKMSEPDLVKSIEILGSSADTKEELMTLCEDLQGLKLFDSLIFRPSCLIISFLQVLLKATSSISQWSLDHHDYTLIMDIFKVCQPCSKHEEKQVRSIYFQLLIDLASKEQDVTSQPYILTSILIGIVDPNKVISQSVRNFCSTPPRLPTQSISRAIRILFILFPVSQSMISEQLCLDRHKFLALATNLLLEMTSHSPDFIKPYFDKCLVNNMAYEALSVAKISSQTTRTMLPHFIEQKVSAVVSPVASHEKLFKIPTTKNIPLISKNFDWIKVAASLKLSENNLSDESILEYSSEWPSSQIPGVDTHISLRSQSSFLGLSKYHEDNQNEKIINKDQTIEHRFAKVWNKASMSNENDADFYRKRTIETQRRQEKKFSTKRNIHESGMFLYRSYRTGKVPDIQIQNSAIITSLQMLAQYQENFAGELFSHLYDKLLKEGSLILNIEDFQEDCCRIKTCLDNILCSCKSDDKILVSSCLNIAISHSSILVLQPRYVYNAAVVTNNELLSTMLMERYVQNETLNEEVFTAESEPLRKNLRRSDNEFIASIAPFLLKLYKDLDLNEEIVGFFENHIPIKKDSVLEKLRLALEFDCKENYTKSFRLYNEILTKSDLSLGCGTEIFKSEVISVSEEGLINSLKKLSKWSDLTTFLEQHSSYDLTKPSKTFRTIVNGKLRLVLEKEEESFLEQLETLLSDDSSHIQERDLLMSKEMAIFNILTDDLAKAEHYCRLAYTQILGNTNNCDFLTDFRIKQLQNMQILYEMSEFIKAKDISSHLSLLKRWTTKLPDRHRDSIEFWEELIFYRQIYLKVIKNKSSKENIESIDKCVLDLQLKYIDASIYQNRSLTALNYLQQCRDSSMKYGEESKVSWYFMYGKAWLRSVSPHGTNTFAENVDETVKGICNSLLQLKKLCFNISSGDEYQYNGIMGDCFWTLANIARKDWPLLSNGSINDARFKEIFSDINVTDQNQTIEYFSTKSFCYLEKLLLNFKTMVCMADQQEISNSLMVLSDFCDSQIALVDDDPTIDISSSIYHCFIESTLLSMNQGHFSAKNKFPRILQVAEQIWDVKCKSLVIDICSTIPSWMFLPWLDQMMTYLFSQKSSIVDHTLCRITLDYPHAMFFPFNLRFKDNIFQSTTINKIEKELHNLHLVHYFSVALNQMIQPEDHLLKWIEEVSKQYKPELSESIFNNIVERYQNMFKEIFGYTEDSLLLLNYTPMADKGMLHQAFITEFRQEFVNNFQEDGALILSLTVEKFKIILNGLKERLKMWKLNSTNFKSLNDYSPWFTKYCLQDHFHQIERTSQDWLEVPGQYNNVNSRPFPEKHVKIFTFLPELEVLSSKQKPKKIKIIGDNEQCYKFLIKSGEDLRQDFRIEQLFSVMNVILAQESQARFCSRMQRLIVTFNVVPVSKMIGLLEWVENTVVLQDFLMKTTTTEERKLISSTKKKNYSRFTNNSLYTSSWLSADFEESNKLFADSQRSIINLDLLRRSFMVISKNNEGFFRLRIRFIQQYAIMVAAHYILGIGDRHLHNFLLDESSGNIVGIDFGYSFGVTSIVLSVPELIPFRLTSAFISFLRPAGVSGLFSQTITNILSIFANNQTTIMSILQVFLSDQIIDWVRLSMAIQQPLDNFTKKRITLSRKKLLSKSPSSILLEELNIKHKNSPWFEKFTKYCGDNLTFENTTKELVAMASDHSILARTYRGWDALM